MNAKEKAHLERLIKRLHQEWHEIIDSERKRIIVANLSLIYGLKDNLRTLEDEE